MKASAPWTLDIIHLYSFTGWILWPTAQKWPNNYSLFKKMQKFTSSVFTKGAKWEAEILGQNLYTFSVSYVNSSKFQTSNHKILLSYIENILNCLLQIRSAAEVCVLHDIEKSKRNWGLMVISEATNNDIYLITMSRINDTCHSSSLSSG